MKIVFSGQIFKKNTNTKFDQNPSSGSRVFPCGRSDMATVIIAFRNFANAPKMDLKQVICRCIIWLLTDKSDDSYEHVNELHT